MKKYLFILFAFFASVSFPGCSIPEASSTIPVTVYGPTETSRQAPDTITTGQPSKTFTPVPFKTTAEITPTAEPAQEPCLRPVFTASPIALEKIESIVTLGNLNPPGHTFPTDHIYLYLPRQPGADGPDTVELYAPADLPVTEIDASLHVTAGFIDYTIVFQPCPGIRISYGHVTSLNTAVFGGTGDFSDWQLKNEYSTGGETYRMYSKEVDIPVKAGDLLGTAGGNPGQWALDFNVYDESFTAGQPANPERWQQSNYIHALCPLSLYEPGPLLDRMISLVDREKVAGEAYPWGEAMQDIAGTAKGCWFLDGTVNTYPEDPHLALVRHNIYPSKAALSIGNSLTGIGSGVYTFVPSSTGLLNRDFKDITPDGNIYGFRVENFNGIIIVSMPDKNTLFIEALPGASGDTAGWVFTGNKVIFVR